MAIQNYSKFLVTATRDAWTGIAGYLEGKTKEKETGGGIYYFLCAVLDCQCRHKISYLFPPKFHWQQLQERACNSSPPVTRKHGKEQRFPIFSRASTRREKIPAIWSNRIDPGAGRLVVGTKKSLQILHKRNRERQTVLVVLVFRWFHDCERHFYNYWRA
jgi:hypothetical protein